VIHGRDRIVAMTRLASLRTRALRTVGCFLADEAGATAIEYGLMVALISIALTASIMSIGQGIKVTLYDALVNALSNMI
jgi:Flp pilus assembly pilin Flp